MKRIAIFVVMVMMSLAGTAGSVRYFTYAQAQRTVHYLNAQSELMLYCGYDYEIETYVLLNEVWMERVNSSYYEIWVYGYDAYTGDEVYMPLDLQCVWLYSAGRMYNAAQYLRFHASVRMPQRTWFIPPYHPFSRRVHAAGYVRSYHYDIHRHGWRPPVPPPHGYGPHTQPPLPPYYMRTPQQPAPSPTTAWTPGVDHPQVSNSSRHSGSSSIPTTRPSGSGTTASGGTTTGRDGGAARSGSNSGTTTSRDGGTTTSRDGGTTTPRSGGTTTSRDGGTTTSRSGGTTTSRDGGTTTSRSGGTTTSRDGSGSTTTKEGGNTTTRSTSTTPTRSNTGTASRNAESTGTATTTPTRSGSTTQSRSGGTTTRSTTRR